MFTTPIKRHAHLEVSRRNRAGTTKKNCDTQLDATKRRNAEQENEKWEQNRELATNLLIGLGFKIRFVSIFHFPFARFGNIRTQLLLRLSKKSFVVFHMALAVDRFAASKSSLRSPRGRIVASLSFSSVY